MVDHTDPTLEVMAAALRPFAAVAEHDIGESEADTDRFTPASRHNKAPLLTVGDLRRAATILARLADATPGVAPGEGVPSVGEAELRLCGYCRAWHDEPCGLDCCLQATDPTWGQELARLADATPGVAPGEGVDARIAGLDFAADIADHWHQRYTTLALDLPDTAKASEVNALGFKAIGASVVLEEIRAERARLASPSPARSDRAADRQGDGVETFASIAQWCEETFGPIEPARIVSRAAEEMDELRAEPDKVEEAADVVIVLSRYPGLWDAVQRKMKVNRARQWRLMGDGTGYHVKAEAALATAPTPAPEGVDLPAADKVDVGMGWYVARFLNQSWRLYDDQHFRIGRFESESDARYFAKTFHQALQARLDPQADKVDALRVAAQSAAERLERLAISGFVGPGEASVIATALRTALDAPRDGGA